MRTLIISLFCILSIYSNAQNWADSGATWHYSVFGIISQGYIEIEYISDTIIMGMDSKILKLSSYGVNFESGQYYGGTYSTYEYTYADLDHVYHLVNDEFKVLYDFSAEIGDTLTHYMPSSLINPFCDSIGHSVVSATGIEIVNSESLRWYEVDLIDDGVSLAGRIYEKIGAAVYLFPTNDYCGLDDPYYGPLRCYSDSLFGLYFNPDYEGDCEYIYDFPIPNYFGNDPEWCVSKKYSFGEPCVHNEDLVHYVDNTVIMDSVTYYEIRSRGIHWDISGIGGGDCEHNLENVDYHQAYLRQEGRSIYLYDEVEQSEFKIYDFDLSVGDTITHFNIPLNIEWSDEIFPEEFGPFIISNIDSIYLNSNFRQRFYFETPEQLEPVNEFDTAQYFIEGIGHPLGFLYSYEDFFEYSHFLHSFRDGDFYYYDFPDYLGSYNCDFSVSVKEELMKIEFKIYPNPVDQRVNIEFKDATNTLDVYIYSTTGQLIKSTKYQDLNKLSIDVSDFNSGMYFIEIRTANGGRTVKPFVVN